MSYRPSASCYRCYRINFTEPAVDAQKLMAEEVAVGSLEPTVIVLVHGIEDYEKCPVVHRDITYDAVSFGYPRVALLDHWFHLWMM